MNRQKLLVSVSGGRTSGLMAYLLWTRYKDKYEMIFVFANTSREKEETLLFLHQLEQNFGMSIVWVEAKVWHGVRKSSTHSIVNYNTAARNGEIFEEVIKKYGIPSKSTPHCTRELKTNPIKSFAKSVGFKDCLMVIGYRKDEPKRVNLITAAMKKQWYPLWEWGITKADVAVSWKAQNFDLQLQDWEGNCKLCHKKSKRKLLTQIVSDPNSTKWVQNMEEKYGHVSPKQYKGKLPLMFFRGWQSIRDLLQESKEPFNLAVDKSMITDGSEYDFELDEQEDCADSCEPF